MTDFGSKDELQDQLDKLGKQIEAAREKFARRGSRPGGTHVGHLVELKDRQEKLNREVRAGDGGLWEQMKHTWRADLSALRDSLERAIRYEDEEFKEGHK